MIVSSTAGDQNTIVSKNPLSWIIKDFDYKKGIFILNYSEIRYHNTALQAAIETVNFICESYPPPYTLMLSGGIDSQAMLYSWIQSKKSFNTFSAVYNDNINYYDIKTIQDFANLYNIKINFVNFDLINFLQNDHINYVKKYVCGSPHYTTYMRLADEVKEGTTIFSGNYLKRGGTQIAWSQNEMGFLHYCILGKKNCVPFFFNETQNLTYAFKDIENRVNISSGYLVKVNTYQFNGFPVIPQDEKFNGFEKIKELYDDIENSEIQKMRENFSTKVGNSSRRNFDILFRNRYEALYRHHKYIHINKGVQL